MLVLLASNSSDLSVITGWFTDVNFVSQKKVTKIGFFRRLKTTHSQAFFCLLSVKKF